ncbi:MAG: hypothetical protein GY696_35585, partial [Gammaproteobacteria bacterium]|nr:hypothetical protein [Gammaproteobacteria bacterium]
VMPVMLGHDNIYTIGVGADDPLKEMHATPRMTMVNMVQHAIALRLKHGDTGYVVQRVRKSISEPDTKPLGKLGVCWVGAAIRAVNYYFPDQLMNYITPAVFKKEFPLCKQFAAIWSPSFNNAIRDNALGNRVYPPYVACGNIWVTMGSRPSVSVPCAGDPFCLFPDLVRRVPSWSVGHKDGPRSRYQPTSVTGAYPRLPILVHMSESENSWEDVDSAEDSDAEVSSPNI